MSVAWSPQYDLNLVFTINDTGETLTADFGLNENFPDAGREASFFFFADGTVWNTAEAMSSSIAGATEGDDVILGSPLSDTISGLGGDDIIIGSGGDDIIDGGTGNDTLLGSGSIRSANSAYHESPQANGNDTYIFGRGYGHDTIIDGDTTPNIDRLQFKDDISPADLTVKREGLDLALTVKDSDDVVTLQKYFAEISHKDVEIHPYEIRKKLNLPMPPSGVRQLSGRCSWLDRTTPRQLSATGMMM